MVAVQLPLGVNRRYAGLGAIALGATWLWVALDRPYTLPDHRAWNVYSNRTLSEQTAEVHDVFDFPALICGETQWNQSVVFTCDQSVGGIGNLRNTILNCVRYAISAGASLVLPSIVLRNTSDISQIRTGVKTDLSYMFDTQHFLDPIRLSCPPLQIHLSINDIKDFENAHEAISLVPESLVDSVPATGLPEPAAWRGQFYTWLEQFSTPEVTTRPMIIHLGRSYLQYPIYSDGEAFALSFGSILKFRSDVRVLAVKTLQSLADTYSLTLDLTQDILPNAFFGAHLRTEKDATEGWPAPDWIYSRFDTQSCIYLEQAPRSNSSVIYVASGDLDEVAKFARHASTSPNNFTVITKFDLLQGEELEELQALKWDQQALVDFLVMLKATDFAGIGHSSFAWNIALKRHVSATQKTHLDGPQMLSDELSQIYGLVRGYSEYAASLRGHQLEDGFGTVGIIHFTVYWSPFLTAGMRFMFRTKCRVDNDLNVFSFVIFENDMEVMVGCCCAALDITFPCQLDRQGSLERSIAGHTQGFWDVKRGWLSGNRLRIGVCDSDRLPRQLKGMMHMARKMSGRFMIYT